MIGPHSTDTAVEQRVERVPLSRLPRSGKRPTARKGGLFLTLTYVGLMAFAVLYFFRPEDFIAGLASLPLAKAAGFLAGIALAFAILGEGVRLPKDSKLLLALFVYLCIGIPFSYWPGGSFGLVVSGFSKYILVAIACACALTTAKRLSRFIFVQCLAMLMLAILAIIFPSRVVGRMYGAGQMFSDPNDFALNLCIVIPFCVAFLLSTRSAVRKLFWGGAAIVMLFAIVLTFSRGGALALFALIPCMLIRFRIKVASRILLLFLVLFGFGGAVLVVGGSSYMQRLDTNQHPDTEDSAAARKQLLKESVSITFRHPVLGVGIGEFEEVSRAWHQTHNTYTQLSSEAGIPALLLLLYMIYTAFKNLRSFKTRGTERTWYLGNATYCALVAYVVGAFFLSTALWLVPYLVMAYSFVLYKLSGELETEDLPAPSLRGNPARAPISRSQRSW